MIFHLSSLWTIVIDIIVWFCIHLGVSVLISMKEQSAFNPDAWLYRENSQSEQVSYETPALFS